MIKITSVIICIILFVTNIDAQQSIVESSKGESSLIFPNAGITFNTTDPKITVSYYYGVPKLNLYAEDSRVKINKDYSKADLAIINKCRIVAGGAVSGKNEDGVAALFKDGKFTPGGEFSGVFGWTVNLAKNSISTGFNTFKTAKDDRIKLIEKKDNDYIKLKQAVIALKSEINANTAAMKTLININGGLKHGDELIKMCDAFIAETPTKDVDLRTAIENLKKDSIWNDSTLTDSFKSSVTTTLQLLIEVLGADDNIVIKTTIINKYRSTVDKYFSHSLIPFVSGKYMVKGFTQYLPDSSISKKFHDTTSNTGYLKFQLNYIFRKREDASENIQYHIFGLGFGINWIDNYNSLTSISIQEDKTFYKDSTTTGKSSKTKNAKKGSFFYFKNYSLDFDYLFIKNFDNYSIMVNPYLRSTFRLSAKDSIKKILINEKGDYRYNKKGSLSFGLGIYFTAPKNIFICGFFVEYAVVPSTMPELDSNGNSNLSKADKFSKNLFFGLVTKINFFKFRQDQLFTNTF